MAAATALAAAANPAAAGSKRTPKKARVPKAPASLVGQSFAATVEIIKVSLPSHSTLLAVYVPGATDSVQEEYLVLSSADGRICFAGLSLPLIILSLLYHLLQVL